jgi:hypothetical protein
VGEAKGSGVGLASDLCGVAGVGGSGGPFTPQDVRPQAPKKIKKMIHAKIRIREFLEERE